MRALRIEDLEISIEVNIIVNRRKIYFLNTIIDVNCIQKSFWRTINADHILD